MSIRPIKSSTLSQATVEGAGVKLRRAFGFKGVEEFDPFLLLDDFRNENPADYVAGFPWHPHRGIETITYVLAGSVEHADSLGNEGRLGAGDIQWMTAGRGVLHQEMPKGDAQGRMHGFQLWANLPSALKMTAPRYQEFKSEEVPLEINDQGVAVRVVCGEFWGRRGPVQGLAASPMYLDVDVPAGCVARLPVEAGKSVFAYVFQGEARFNHASPPQAVPTERVERGLERRLREPAGDRSLLLFDSGDEIVLQASDEGVRFLLVAGQPIREPIAWWGPIVMNERSELERAVAELRNGTFIDGALAARA